jgi:23S rRNA (guanosine2251-2'-O)-methyltransferase
MNKNRPVILNSKQLRSDSSKSKNEGIVTNEIYIVLDNVLDTYNVGAIFRLSDGVAAKKLILCDKTPIPPDHKIKKASINTTGWVNWEYSESTSEAIKNLKKEVKDLKVIAVEQSKDSISYLDYQYNLPICIVVGNESYGVSQDVLDLCDATVELPMYGVNVSLNVMVSLGIVLYKALENSV